MKNEILTQFENKRQGCMHAAAVQSTIDRRLIPYQDVNYFAKLEHAMMVRTSIKESIQIVLTSKPQQCCALRRKKKKAEVCATAVCLFFIRSCKMLLENSPE